MAQTSRIICRVAVQTVADRRVRRGTATLPAGDTTFSEEEKIVFKTLDRRLRPRPPTRPA